MGRGKERCPQCGSKKIIVHTDSKKCKVCGHQWTGRVRKKTPKKRQNKILKNISVFYWKFTDLPYGSLLVFHVLIL